MKIFHILPLLNSWLTSSAIFFMRKITIIRNKIISDCPNNTGNISMDADIMFNGNMLKMFRLSSQAEVKKIITKSTEQVM